jgi:hypothetical protein
METVPPTPLDGGDLAGFDVHARAFAHMVLDPALPTPFVLAVSGKWGVGKTSFAHLLERHVTADAATWPRRAVTLWFNAWQWDEGGRGMEPLLHQVAAAADRRRTPWRRLAAPLPGFLVPAGRRWVRRLLRPLLLLLALAALGAALHRSAPAAWQPWVSPIDPETLGFQPGGGLLALAVALLLALAPTWVSAAQAASGLLDRLKGWIRPPGPSAVREEMAALLREAVGADGRLVVFVDGLDRCRPATTWAILRGIQGTFGDGARGLVVVLLADVDGLAAALEGGGVGGLARTHLPPELQERLTLYETAEPPGSFLARILHMRFDLPPPTEGDLRRLVESLWRGPGGQSTTSR